MVYLVWCDPYVSRYSPYGLEHLDIIRRLAQPQLREYRLDVHVRLAKIGKAYRLEEIARQRESYAVYLSRYHIRHLHATVLISIERRNPPVKRLRVGKLCQEECPRGDRPAKALPQAPRIVVQLAP